MEKINIKSVVAFFITFSLGIIGGYFIFEKSDSDEPTKLHATRQTGFKYTNPLLECEPDSLDISFKELVPFKDKLERKISEITTDKRASSIAVYFRDLNNGPWIGIGEREIFSPASLLKVPIMLAYFKAAEIDQSILKDSLEFKMPKDAGGNPLIKKPVTLEDGKTYSVEELIRTMIQKSDNAAAELLSNHLNPQILKGPYYDLGVPLPENIEEDANINVRQYASFFRVLFNASYLSRAMSEQALAILSKTDFTQGLQKGIPGAVEVSHKYGERVLNDTKQLHDCGIVYYPGKPYLICVMTRGSDLQKLPDVIGEISKLVYEEVDNQLKN